MIRPISIGLSFLLAGCFEAEPDSLDMKLFREEFASVEGVLQAIEICRGFGEDWDGWLAERKSAGWEDMWDEGMGALALQEGIRVQFANLKKGDRAIDVELHTYPEIGEPFTGKSARIAGKSGRCDMWMQVESYQAEKDLVAKVRNQMPKIKPDWNGTTYFTENEELTFNQMKNVKEGNPVRIIVQVGFDDIPLNMPEGTQAGG